MSDLPRIIYIHGFNSSPESLKARLLVSEFERLGLSSYLAIPKLSHWPAQAIDDLSALIRSEKDVLLLGSSLGGFYATWLTEQFPQVRSVLINPAVAPHHLLKPLLGETENYYSGERYLLTENHLSQLTSFYLEKPSYPERMLLLQQEGDETLDYRDAVSYYRESRQIVQPGGNHGFEDFITMIPLILSYAKRDLNDDVFN